jgi:lipoprotein-anchoring transpeptidase ErfK/SrfK
MQCSSWLSLAILTTIAAGGTALAGPLPLNPETYLNSARPAARAAAPPHETRSIGTIFATPQSDEVRSWPVHRVAAQRDCGGGFFQLLFCGAGQGERPATYQGVPADYGPGMVDTPYGRPVLDPRYMRQEVSYEGKEAAGTIIINTGERMLYLVQGDGRALRYGIGVGRPGFTWSGVHHISQKREWPGWTPPPEMLRRRPDLPRHMEGGPENPLGARAMYLGSTLYRIHGSNEPWTIGTQVSSGCIRMRNEDVIDLYGRVKIGTKVVVL